LPDGVHPNRADMEKIAEVWWTALQAVLRESSPQQ
jgi:lysophospholipase L1-like esterase